MEKTLDFLEFLGFLIGVFGISLLPVYFFWWTFIK